MEQVLKKSFWEKITGARSQPGRKSVLWPLLLAVSGILLLVLLLMVLVTYFLIGSRDIPAARGLLVGIAITGVLLWLAGSLAITACLNRLILRRVQALQEGADRVNSGDFQHPIPAEKPDELGMLAEQINRLAGELDRRNTMLESAHKKAVVDSQSKSDMLARVSHDLRQPLGVILGFSEMIRDEIIGPVTNPQRRAVSEIISSTARLSQLVTDLLDSSRLEAHSLSLRIDAFSPALLLRQLSDQVSPQAERKNIAFSTELDPDLPEALRGDPKCLLVMLINLAVNAIKFTQQGSVHIRIFRSGADHWAFSVADTGQGIPAEALDHIFEPFWQGDDPATRDKGGVGLGLSIVQQLVQLMDAHIQVESAVGVGSTFVVTLPIDPGQPRGEV